MTIRAYCRIPIIKSKSLRPQSGGCPELLEDLLVELEGAKELHIAAYLFNNPVYSAFLSNLASTGCKIYITTLPERGYSNKKLKVEGFNEKVSGQDVAKSVFSQMESLNSVSLRFFPHQYMWYGALYAGGGASYSFHVKALYAKYSNSKNRCFLSSGNFMCSDPYHSDSLIVFEDEPTYEAVFSRFFKDLESYSLSYDHFKKHFLSYKDEFLVSHSGKELHLVCSELSKCFFTAPFYMLHGQGSNHYASKQIINLIKAARQRIWVCAQHFHDVLSFDQNRESFVKHIYDKACADPYIELRFLKQVPHSSLADKRRAAITETLFKYGKPALQKYNRLVHDKFMLIDNTLVFSTANFTPTQFAFGKRKMEFKDVDGNKLTKEDNFSEVNGFAIIPNCPVELLKQFEEHYDLLWQGGEDISVNL